MQCTVFRSSRAAAWLAVALSSAGCAEDLKLDTDDAAPATVVTEPAGDNVFTTRVDASSADVWVYFSFLSGGQVIPVDAAHSLEWDLGFQRFHIVSNGGASGTGGATVAMLAGLTFDAVTAAPTDGYISDQPDSDDGDMIANSAFEDEDGWYAYDETTNRLSPRPNVYVLETARGAHYKLTILDYYDAAGSGGHPSFSWSEL